MSAQDCIDKITQGGKFSETEALEILDLLLETTKEQRLAHPGWDEDALLAEAAKILSGNFRRQAMIEKRNHFLAGTARETIMENLRRNWSDRPDLGLEALLVGVNTARKGARMSVGAQQRELSGSYMAGLMNDIERAGHWPLFTSGSMDKEISQALWQLNAKEPQLDGFSGPALDMAKILRKWQDVARIDANKAGADIGKLDNYVVRQTHDLFKIRAVEFEEWRDFILPRLNGAETFKKMPWEYGKARKESIDDFLRSAYEGLASGVHLKNGQHAPGEMPRVTGKAGNLAKRLSQERVLHFKDADAWFEYNERFGSGSLRETMFGSLDKMAESTALMRVLGPNPEANFQAVADEALKELASGKEARNVMATALNGKLKNRLDEVTGRTKIPVSATGARISAVVRSLQNMAKLGGATISAISDLPIGASEFAYQGQSFLGGLSGQMVNLVKGRPKGEAREIMSSLGVFFDSMRGEAVSRFSADDTLPGQMARAQQTFFKWNLLTWWTETLRSSAALTMSHYLAQNGRRSWSQLKPELQRVLSLYDIEEADWDAIRANRPRMADGRKYVVPEGLPPAVASKLRAYVTDRASYAVIEPDVRTRAILKQGSQPGTPTGELIRFIGQFKAFPIAVLQKAVGREIYGRGADPRAFGDSALGSFGKALVNGQGEMLGLARLMAMTTLFGYGAMTAKEMLKGRNPRDPAAASTWVAAALQGGALGIYGDFLFGQANRFGGSLVQTLSGPTLGGVDDLAEIYSRIRDGDDAASASFRFMLSNTPYLNLFYSRIVLDYLFFHQVSEMMNPGYTRRLERRVKKENKQTFWLRPSEAVGV